MPGRRKLSASSDVQQGVHVELVADGFAHHREFIALLLHRDGRGLVRRQGRLVAGQVFGRQSLDGANSAREEFFFGSGLGGGCNTRGFLFFLQLRTGFDVPLHGFEVLQAFEGGRFHGAYFIVVLPYSPM